MRGWMVAVVVMGMLTGTVAQGLHPYLPSRPEGAPELESLQARLAAQEALLARLEEEQALYEKAEQLGVAAAVEASRLPGRQQRRLAVAIVREAQRNGLDPMLVVAVIRCESSFNNYAVSSVGAMGLMQVMPATGTYLADRVGLKLERTTNLFDSELNVELGTAYLADLIQRFGSVAEALVAYNAGPGLAKRILSRRAARDRFLAGYPAKVLREYRKLKAQQAREVTRREEKPTSGGPG